MANAPARRQQAVKPITSTVDDLLLCKDRSIGHDWPHEMSWEDGEKIPMGQGRRSVQTCWRVCRCIRCGTIRKELFVTEMGSNWLYKVTNGNRYLYPEAWKHFPKMEQAEIRMRLYEAQS